MRYILTLPVPFVVICAFIFVALCFCFSLLLLRLRYWEPEQLSLNLPVPAFIGVIATAWALSLGFAASDSWTLGNRADQAVAAERSAVMRLLGAASPRALGATQLQESVKSYIHLVEHHENSRRSGSFLGDPAVDAAIESIRVTIIQIARSDIPGAIATKVVNDFDELQDARNARLGVNVSLIDTSKWSMLLALTFLTMVTIALVHADRPPAGRNASAIFSIAAFAGLWILIVHMDPLSDRRPDYLSYNLASSILNPQ